jgi:hypothetical protein
MKEIREEMKENEVVASDRNGWMTIAEFIEKVAVLSHTQLIGILNNPKFPKEYKAFTRERKYRVHIFEPYALMNFLMSEPNIFRTTKKNIELLRQHDEQLDNLIKLSQEKYAIK